ncbi:hypothetical protein ACFXTO_027687 [Malus domestica]
MVTGASAMRAVQPTILSSFVGNRLLQSAHPLHQLFGFHPVGSDLYCTKPPPEISVWCSKRAMSILSTINSKSPSPSQLNLYLQLCCNSKSLNKGKQAHQMIIEYGFDKNPFLVTKLVQMYADCDDLVSAWKLFDKLLNPNVFAWTAILGFYSRHGMYEKCVRAYGEMILKGVLPDGYVFPKVLKACSQLSSVKVGFLVHKDVIIRGFELNVQVCNSLIDMYSKCKDVRSAKQVFDEMVERDLLSWNFMISGYVCNGMLGLAVELFDCMHLDVCEPDVVTLNTVMDAYCRLGHCDEAKRIFEQIKDPNIISWTTLISGFSRIGNHESSLKIFRDMMDGSRVYPDLDSLSAVLVSCRHLGSLLNGKEIHGYGIKIGSAIAFYSSAGPALLILYANCSRIQDAINVFRLMNPADVVSWNAMILGFIDLGLEDLALECFRKMQRAQVKADQTTISTVLPTCNLKFGKQIHAFVRKSSFDLVAPVWNALIHMYAKCGCIESAYSVFSNMVNRDLVTWNSMIGGFGMHGDGRAALELLQEMNHSGTCPNSVTFTSVLSACCHSGLVDEGLQVFYSMTREYSVIPSMEHYACVVDMLARDGQLEDAVNFIHRMPLEPDKCIWGALLAACRAHQNVNVAKLAAEQLILLEPENSGHYVTLSNIYTRAGRWEDAVRVRKQMEAEGSLKTSGNSWFDCGSKHVSMQLPRKFSGLTNLLFNGRNVDKVVNKRKRLRPGKISPQRPVPDHILRPPYVKSKKSPGIASGPEVHDEKGIECMRTSGRLAAQVLEYAGTLVKPGTKTDEIDQAVHQMIIDNGAYPSPLGYGGFPKSVCTSVNECICHGIPDSRALEDGDIVNIDVTVYLNGYHGDTSTTFFCGDVDNEARKDHADKNRYGVVRQFVGHGVGRVFHADPVILHFRNNDSGRMLLNQTFTIEPMLTMGSYNAVMWDDNWTVVTEDGSLSAQFEHTILITEDGAEILTQC